MWKNTTLPLAALAFVIVASLGGRNGGQAWAEESVFDPPLNPATCGDRLNRLYDGDFTQFWTYVERHGFTAVVDFAWATPERDGESFEDWRVRAYDCVLEVERANHLDETAEMAYALGYFMWFATASIGFNDDDIGGPDVRERAYRRLRNAASAGSDPAREALIQVHLDMVRMADQRVAYAARNQTEASLPDWWPPRDQILQSLDRMAKSGYDSGFLAIATIYSDRALLVTSTGFDHNGQAASEPDARLIEASRAYRQVWEERQQSRQAAVGTEG
ncbi:MAG: hypothetical protein RIM33_07040 [Alphaproteobacteria bacterium]